MSEEASIEALASVAQKKGSMVAGFVRSQLRKRLGDDLANKEAVEDVVSESFLKACSLMRARPNHSPEDPEEVLAWLLRICVFKVLEYCRKQHRSKIMPLTPHEQDLLTYHDVIDYVDSRGFEELTEFTEILDKDERNLLEMYFKEGFTSKEIANRLALSAESVRQRKSRLLRKLRKFVANRSL